MAKLNVLKELEALYTSFMDSGDLIRAKETLLSIQELRDKSTPTGVHESTPDTGKNILLG
jgi:hypothetical protein